MGTACSCKENEEFEQQNQIEVKPREEVKIVNYNIKTGIYLYFF